MSRVRIIQLLCPSRHCIVATAYESPDGSEIPELIPRLLEKFDAFVASGANRRCGICGSTDLKPEDRATAFTTMVDAAPHLSRVAAEQAMTREFFRASKG